MADIQGPAIIPMNLEGLINNRRRALLVKNDKFEDLRKVHMPGAQDYIEELESNDVRAVDAEHHKIYMPSDIPANRRRAICAEGLPPRPYSSVARVPHSFLLHPRGDPQLNERHRALLGSRAEAGDYDVCRQGRCSFIPDPH